MIYCHECGERVLNSQVVRTNIKVSENTTFSYDVSCPYCHKHIGQVLWGKYIPNPNIEHIVVAPQKRVRSYVDRRIKERRISERRCSDRRKYIFEGLDLSKISKLRYVDSERRSGERREDDRRNDERRNNDRRSMST